MRRRLTKVLAGVMLAITIALTVGVANAYATAYTAVHHRYANFTYRGVTYRNVYEYQICNTFHSGSRMVTNCTAWWPVYPGPWS